MTLLPVEPAWRLDERSEEHRWLIAGLWAEEAVGVVGGEPKCCKSFLALDIAVAVASGAPCLRRFGVPRAGRVLLYAAEDALHIVRRRLDGICEAAGLDLADLDILVITAPTVRLDIEADRRSLADTVARHRPRLLILDPFVRLHRIDENASGEVAPLLAYLRESGQANRKLRYFVNLSRVSISDQQWIRRFHSLLSSGGVNPSQLVFEITETAAMSEIDVTITFIKRLKEMGCRFALDDFGAGFSSFYYLKRFDVDYLKIDGGFIRDLAADEGSRIFVRALNDIAHGLDKQVIAEWVETPEALNLLVGMGTHFGQGYLFHRPVPLDQKDAVAEPVRDVSGSKKADAA